MLQCAGALAILMMTCWIAGEGDVQSPNTVMFLANITPECITIESEICSSFSNVHQQTFTTCNFKTSTDLVLRTYPYSRGVDNSLHAIYYVRRSGWDACEDCSLV